jgi:hypothetical protein
VFVVLESIAAPDCHIDLRKALANENSLVIHNEK